MKSVANQYLGQILATRLISDAVDSAHLCYRNKDKPICVGCLMCYKGLTFDSFYWIIADGHIYLHADDWDQITNLIETTISMNPMAAVTRTGHQPHTTRVP